MPTPASILRRKLNRLPHLPVVRPGYQLIELNPGRYLLHSSVKSFEVFLPVPGTDFPGFLRRLDGENSLEDLVNQLPVFQATILLDVVGELHNAGVVVDGVNRSHGTESNRNRRPTSLLFDRLLTADDVFRGNTDNRADEEAKERFRHTRVCLVGIGAAGSQVARLLALSGIRFLTCVDDGIVDQALASTDAWFSNSDLGNKRVVALGRHLSEIDETVVYTPVDVSLSADGDIPATLGGQDVIVVAADRSKPQGYFETINRYCVRENIPWTSYRPTWGGLSIEIGPTVFPKESACFDCLGTRRKANILQIDQQTFVSDALFDDGTGRPTLPFMPCLSLFSLEILRIVSGVLLPWAANAVLSFDLGTGELVRRPLLKEPYCPTCRRNVREFGPTRYWAELQTELESDKV